MDIEILSVSKNDDSYELMHRTAEIRDKLQKHGFSLTYINSVSNKPAKLKDVIDASASNPEKPDIIIVANALSTTDSTSFRKYCAETVVAAERAENKPVPKNYWKKRNADFSKAKKQGASQEELNELADSYRLYKKKSKIFNLGDFGNGYKGYCFMYKGVMVGVLPQAVLTGADVRDVITLASIRIKEVFENSAEDYPNGFSNREYIPPKTGFVNRFIPVRGDSSGEVMRKVVLAISFLVFVSSLSLLFYNTVYLSAKNDELNSQIKKVAYGNEVDDEQNSDTGKEEKEINWKALNKINDDIVGWIKMDNTKIDYPTLWCKTDDRNYQYYLSHNYKGDYDYSGFGSIFLDYRCKKGVDSKNVVLHGHHIRDGSMFGNLMEFGVTKGNLDFYKKTPSLEFNTPKENATYKIISVFKTNTLSSHGEFFNYMIGDFQNEKDFMNYVYNVRVRSLINCPVDVNEDDELITLSTCSYEFTNFRTVVVARKVRKGESVKVDVSRASVNKNPVWPQVYYNAYGGTRPTVTDFCTAYEAGKIDWYNGEYDFKEQKIKETKPISEEDKTKATEPTTEPKVYCEVKFINYDKTVLSTQKVEYGKAAKAPKNPVKPSDEYYDYVFKGWQLDFSKVTSNMTIAPKFEPVLKEKYATTQGGETQ